LNAAQLNAVASIAGSFAYSPAAGQIPSVGTKTLSVTFTPTDVVDYTPTTAAAQIVVGKATPTIAWVSPATIIVGTALSNSQLEATSSVPGSFMYSPGVGTVLPAGAQTLSAIFTPNDTTDYAVAQATVSLTVDSKANPTITWAAPATISYGTALSSTQLDAAASVPGTFVYAPGSGVVLPAGAQTLSVTFTPTDTKDYTTATGTISLDVSQAKPVINALRFISTPQVVRSEQPFQYQVVADLADGTTQDVTTQATWVTDPQVAALSPGGLLDCNHVGSASLTAAYSGLSVGTQIQCLLRSNPPDPGFLDSSSTFAGPFLSWTNVKIAFGAKGDGVTDDSDAFMNAIASFNAGTTVLYIPHGTYVISKPLVLTSLQAITIVGENPLTTALQWQGPVDQTVLTGIGSSHMDIGRLTIDGGSLAAADIDIDSGGEYYPTYNYIHDVRLINSGKGLIDGFAGETTIERAHFDNNSLAGLSLESFNAQNINVVDSLFTKCSRGVTNWYGAGGFNVSNSYFIKCSVADLSMGNTGPFSVRNNVSIDPIRFFEGLGNGAPSNIVIQGNTIVNPSATPILMGSPGPMILIDNRFLKADPSLNFVSGSNSDGPLQLLSLGNRFTVPNPFNGPMNFTSIDELPYAQDEDSVPTVPSEIYVPPSSTAHVFEVAVNANSSQIQQVIATAVSAGKSVVHFPAGKYVSDTTISIPPEADISLIGDGETSWLSASSQLQGPILNFQGTNILLQNLQVGNGANENASIEIHVPDQPDSYVRCDDCATAGHTNSSLEVDGLDDAVVIVGVATLNSGNWAATIHGGVARQNGITTIGRVAAYGASTDAFRVDNSGHFLLEDGWHDAGQGPIQMALSGKGVVAHEGGTIYSYKTPALFLNDYTGEYTLAGTAMNTNLLADAGSNATVLFAGTIQESGLNPIVSLAQFSSVSQIETYSTANNGWPYTSYTANQIQDSETEHRMRIVRSQYRPPLPVPAFGTRAIFNRLKTSLSPIGLHIESVGGFSNGAYRFEPKGANGQSSSCSQGSQITNGTWTLVDGDDESYGLLSDGTFLAEASGSNGPAPAVVTAPAMASARVRWFVVPNGDGTSDIVNHATGDRMTLEADGCTSPEPFSGASNQMWRITNTNSPSSVN
jgi:hypothetical protein